MIDLIPTIESDRLILRAWRNEDAEPFSAYYDDPQTARFLGGNRSVDQAWRSMAGYVGHWVLRGFGLWVLEDKSNGDFAGYAGGWFPHGWPEHEIAYGLAPEKRGKGLAAEAVIRVRNHLYKRCGWQTAISVIEIGNEKSAAVAERVGAAPERELEIRGIQARIYRHPPPG